MQSVRRHLSHKTRNLPMRTRFAPSIDRCWMVGTGAVLRAVVGMVPPGQSDLNPQLNALQTLVAMPQLICDSPPIRPIHV